MSRGVVAILLVGLAFPATSARGQRVVPIDQEPRHRLMAEIGDLRVLDIRILPGDTTLFHRHDEPVLYVAFDRRSTSAQELGRPWSEPRIDYGEPGEISANVDYLDAPVSHRVTNVGERLFHILGILNSGEGTAPGDYGPDELPGSVELDNRWYRASRIVLEGRAETGWYVSPSPVVAVLSSAGRVRVRYPDDWSESLSRFGDFALARPAERYRLENTGPSDVEVVLVQAR